MESDPSPASGSLVAVSLRVWVARRWRQPLTGEPHRGTAKAESGSSIGDRYVWPGVVEAVGRASHGVPLVGHRPVIVPQLGWTKTRLRIKSARHAVTPNKDCGASIVAGPHQVRDRPLTSAQRLSGNDSGPSVSVKRYISSGNTARSTSGTCLTPSLGSAPGCRSTLSTPRRRNTSPLFVASQVHPRPTPDRDHLP